MLCLEAIENQEPFWLLPLIVDIFIFLSLELFVKTQVWESSKGQRLCPCNLTIEEKPVLV